MTCVTSQGICDLLDPSFTDLKIREDKDVRVNACQKKNILTTTLQRLFPKNCPLHIDSTIVLTDVLLYSCCQMFWCFFCVLCVCVLQNNVKVHGLKEYVVTNIEEVTRVIFVGNSEFFFLLCFEPSAPFIVSHTHSLYPFISCLISLSQQNDGRDKDE